MSSKSVSADSGDNATRKTRREIANSNERRRMQNINSGFEELKALIPRVSNSDKLSKASILQMSAAYIEELQASRMQLLNEVLILRSKVNNNEVASDSEGDAVHRSRIDSFCNELVSDEDVEDAPPRKRMRRDPGAVEGSDVAALKQELRDTQMQLQVEQQRNFATIKGSHSRTSVPSPMPPSTPGRPRGYSVPTSRMDHAEVAHTSLHAILEAMRQVEGDKFDSETHSVGTASPVPSRSVCVT